MEQGYSKGICDHTAFSYLMKRTNYLFFSIIGLETEGCGMKKFNVTGICVPEDHYMVNIEGKLSQIMNFVHDANYFTINRARQFGKTTTLVSLERFLNNTPDYICVSLSFEGVGLAMFSAEDIFCRKFLDQMAWEFNRKGHDFANNWLNGDIKDFETLGKHISKLCANKKIVLIIDEVDATSSNRIFLLFLGMLRSLFLQRQGQKAHTFHSVILAGVHDIKNIKLKLINEGLHSKLNENEGEYNSPWNIATNFTVDMSFSVLEISTMLEVYEKDHNTGMDINSVSEEIFRFTNGYPYLVSRLCQFINNDSSGKWTVTGVQNAVKTVALEKSVLKDDIFKNMENNKAIYDFMYGLLVGGSNKRVSVFDPVVERCVMFGFIIVDSAGRARIANKIFEMAMMDYFISKENSAGAVADQVCYGMYNEITGGGKFNMELCMRKFAEHYEEIYADADSTFLERHGRMIFLSFLKPLVNGMGFFHIESQFTDMRRMDVVVDYGNEQFIIELKLWKGEKAQERAYDQLLDYINSRHLDKGYLLTFNFRKNENKERKTEWVQVNGKDIFEVIV
jgi:hypothetical protein